MVPRRYGTFINKGQKTSLQLQHTPISSLHVTLSIRFLNSMLCRLLKIGSAINGSIFCFKSCPIKYLRFQVFALQNIPQTSDRCLDIWQLRTTHDCFVRQNKIGNISGREENLHLCMIHSTVSVTTIMK